LTCYVSIFSYLTCYVSIFSYLTCYVSIFSYLTCYISIFSCLTCYISIFSYLTCYVSIFSYLTCYVSIFSYLKASLALSDIEVGKARRHYLQCCLYGVATISRLLKILGLFAKEPCKRDDILQKRPIILRSLLIVATPYVCRKSARCQTYYVQRLQTRHMTCHKRHDTYQKRHETCRKRHDTYQRTM